MPSIVGSMSICTARAWPLFGRNSDQGKPVPIKWVQAALDMLERDGEVIIDVKTVGYRSAFIGAVLALLLGVRTALAPRRVFRT